MITFIRTSLISVLVILLSACSLRQSALPPVNNGFIVNYERMASVKNDDGVVKNRWVSRKLTRKIAPLEPVSFYIKPVIFYPQLEIDEQISLENAEKIKKYLDQNIRETVAKYFVLSNTLGPDVFVLEPAITRMRISLEDLSPLEVLPFKAVISGVNYALGGRDRDVEFRLENKLTLADSGELLVTTVYRGEGLQLENDREQLTAKHVKALLDSWIKQWDSDLANYRLLIDQRNNKSDSGL